MSEIRAPANDGPNIVRGVRSFLKGKPGQNQVIGERH